MARPAAPPLRATTWCADFPCLAVTSRVTDPEVAASTLGTEVPTRPATADTTTAERTVLRMCFPLSTAAPPAGRSRRITVIAQVGQPPCRYKAVLHPDTPYLFGRTA